MDHIHYQATTIDIAIEKPNDIPIENFQPSGLYLPPAGNTVTVIAEWPVSSRSSLLGA